MILTDFLNDFVRRRKDEWNFFVRVASSRSPFLFLKSLGILESLSEFIKAQHQRTGESVYRLEDAFIHELASRYGSEVIASLINMSREVCFSWMYMNNELFGAVGDFLPAYNLEDIVSKALDEAIERFGRAPIVPPIYIFVMHHHPFSCAAPSSTDIIGMLKMYVALASAFLEITPDPIKLWFGTAYMMSQGLLATVVEFRSFIEVVAMLGDKATLQRISDAEERYTEFCEYYTIGFMYEDGKHKRARMVVTKVYDANKDVSEAVMDHITMLRNFRETGIFSKFFIITLEQNSYKVLYEETL